MTMLSIRLIVDHFLPFTVQSWLCDLRLGIGAVLETNFIATSIRVLVRDDFLRKRFLWNLSILPRQRRVRPERRGVHGPLIGTRDVLESFGSPILFDLQSTPK